MNKYFFTPALFIRFSGISFRKKIAVVFSFLFLFFFSNSVSAQWVNYGTPIANNLYDMSFINASTGWGISNVESKVIKTTNGGVNWTTILTFASSIYNVQFLDENTGFICGTAVSKTTNGGVNWTQSLGSFGATYEPMDFIDSNTGWVADAQGRIHKTTNGGTNWTQQTSPVSSILISMDFFDSNTGWISGRNGVVLKTTNGGINWQQLTTGTSERLYTISFSDAQKGIATGLNGTVLKTTNGGANWIAIVGFDGDLFGAYYMPNTSLIWVTLIAGTDTRGIYCSTNDGANWTRQNSGQNLSQINFTSPSIGYAGSVNGTAYITKTGGFNLSAPSNLTATPVSTSQINLSWTDNTTDEDKFIIERSTNSLHWSILDSVNAGVTTYSNTGLPYSTAYYYRVRAKKLIFTGDASNSELAWTFMHPPELNTPADNYIQITNTPNLAWHAASGASTYSLQVASDTGFTNIVYSITEGGLLNKTIPAGILQNSTKYYWRAKCSNAITQSAYTNYRTFTVYYPDYGNNMYVGGALGLYYYANSTAGGSTAPSQPTYNWRDTTGSINLIVNQTGSPTYGNLDNGAFVLNGVLVGTGKSISMFGTSSQTITVGTNGVIAVGNSDISSLIEPSNAGIPVAPVDLAAAFPFWADLYFEAPAFPSRLCYKRTSTELVITYSKVIMYDDSHITNVNNCISFQVVFQLTTPPTNSKIEVLYNYDETGWLFKQNLTNNTMRQHVIGIQGNPFSQGERVCYYRFQNSAHQLSYAGPIFGSNLAVAFGPNANVLPVELASFTSEVAANNVKLNWSTVSEENNSDFEVERCELSTVNSEWKKIGSVQGNGTTTEAKNYSYEDRNVQSGNYKYRLKQIDYNGNFEYHEISGEVIVGVPNKFALSQNYPNPFNPGTKINLEVPNQSKVVLQVYDVTGRMISELINKEMNAGYYTVDFNAINLSSGIYFYRLAAGGFVETKKMVLMK